MNTEANVQKVKRKWNFWRVPTVFIGITTVALWTTHLLLREHLGEGRAADFIHWTVEMLLLLSMVMMLYRYIRQDLAELIQSKQSLTQTEAQLRALIDAMPNVISFKDADGRWLEANRAAEQLFQLDGVPYRGKTDSQLVQMIPFKKALLTCAASDEQTWEKGQVCQFNETLIMPDGSFRHLAVTKIPTYYPDGRRKGIAILGYDETEQHRAQEELMMAKEQLESLFKNNADGIVVVDLDGKIRAVNDAFEQIFGYTTGELLGKELPLQSEQSKRMISELHEVVINGGQVRGYETTKLKKDGTRIDISLTMSPIRNAVGEVVAISGIIRDISDQKRSMQALQESEERYRRLAEALHESEAKYRLIADNMSDLIRLVALDGTVHYASPSHKQLLGFTPEVFEGQSTFSYVHPDDVEPVKARFGQMVVENSPALIELRYQHCNGNWILLEALGMPITNAVGEVESFVLVGRDITERKRTEELLRNSDKLSMLGQLAAGIAHEIRNPLTALRGFIQLLHTQNVSNSMYCDIMLSELDRINFIVSELLVLAKPQAIHFQKRELGSLLGSVITLLESQALMNNVHILLEHGEGSLPSIVCEENQLKQVFINILKNAIEAMPDGGDIRICIGAESTRRVKIRFIDQGCGISSERVQKLGEPFYTTKEKGTGLGLMVSYKIIENHNGTIKIDSEVGIGTTVHITLPIAE
ncbi:PAS domain S-box protein [Brevibacillus dissolubilis]|uniref:PAS domain S-box protein n=1 Tax=Brevibacillus dissolubilis TaxID=1844116 RepID=UPI00159BBBFA|nr:PAS domain S-box protein [Brevibacillus dissolubilis]